LTPPLPPFASFFHGSAPPTIAILRPHLE
jgi:hypothetical protein